MPLEYIAGVQILLYGVAWTVAAVLVHEERKVLMHWAGYAWLQTASTLLATHALQLGDYPPPAALACSLAGFALATRGVDIFVPPKGELGRRLLTSAALGMAGLLISEAWLGDASTATQARAVSYDVGVIGVELGTAWPLWCRLRAAHGRVIAAVTLVPAVSVGGIAIVAVALHLLLGPQALGQARETARVPNVIVSLVFSAVFNFGYLFLLMARLLGHLRHNAASF